MNYDEFSADLPPERTQEFHSPEELESALSAADVIQPTRQLSDGDFRAHLAITSTESATLFSDRYSTALSLYLETPKDAMSFMFPRTVSGTFFVNGLDVGDELMVAFPSRSGIDISGPGPIGSDCISTNTSKFWAIANVLCPGLEQQKLISLVPGDTRQMFALRDRLVELGATPEPGPSDLDVLKLVVDIIFWIANSHEVWPTTFANTPEARVNVARRAQEFIEEHYREAVRVEDLCRETGVAVRTLQRSFHDYFQVTVSEYLKTVRLDSARRDLVAAYQEESTVTAIAMDNGCAHLGRFSIEFRKRFGLSPKQALETRPGQM